MPNQRMSRRRLLGLLGVAGAGVAGLAGAVKAIGNPAPPPRIEEGTVREVEKYGDLPRQKGEWWLPPDPRPGRLPTVVLVHGGYWRSTYDLSLENAVAADLAGRGFLVWNIDYRPSDDAYPATFVDAAAAYDHLAVGLFADRVDPERVSVVGHSAGGHLALWLASRENLPEGVPGADPRGPRPAAVVGQAPVAALAEGARLGLGAGAVQALMDGEPDELPERYAVSDPLVLLPAAGAVTCVHAPDDDLVPISQSEKYVAAADSGARLVTFVGGHFEHLDPTSDACERMRAALAR